MPIAVSTVNDVDGLNIALKIRTLKEEYKNTEDFKYDIWYQMSTKTVVVRKDFLDNRKSEYMYFNLN